MNLYKISRIPIILTDIIFIIAFVFSVFNTSISNSILMGLVLCFVLIVSLSFLRYYKNSILSVDLIDDLIYLKKSSGKTSTENRLMCKKITINSAQIIICFENGNKYKIIRTGALSNKYNIPLSTFDKNNFPNAEIISVA